MTAGGWAVGWSLFARIWKSEKAHVDSESLRKRYLENFFQISSKSKGKEEQGFICDGYCTHFPLEFFDNFSIFGMFLHGLNE